MERGFAAFAAARLAEARLALRRATFEDKDSVAAIYATTREEELRKAPWSAEQKTAFANWQSEQQEAHYALHYPNAELLLIESEGHVIGRMYVDSAGKEVRLMEMTLLPAYRNQGIGSRLMDELLRYADGLGLPASLHVEPFNPAKRMYTRLGFTDVETRGLYVFMVRTLPS